MRVRQWRAAALVCVALALPTCTAGPIAPTPSPTPQPGGVLRVGVSGDEQSLRDSAFVDPAVPSYAVLTRCCLARAPLAYPGRPTSEGGTVLQPDLAAAAPEISRDGLTWTIRLRPGIHYAPPYEATEVTATDFIHTIERNARVEPESVVRGPDRPYGFVVGAAEYAAGEAPSISGLAAPDPYTLVIRLLEPFGAFGTLLTEVTWAPLPPAALEEHGDDIGPHWVSTGPYMFETYPGQVRDGRLVLVRNPQWHRATDLRRGAWVDRIELIAYGEPHESYGLVERGELDIGDWPLTSDDVTRYRADPTFAGRLRSTADQVLFWVPMNLATPPFDDVTVRRAVNAIVDRAAMRDLIIAARSANRGPQAPGVVTQHVFPDSLTAGLLLTYAPWASPDDHGDLGRARTEMSASRYDSDRDGMCDAEACRGIVLPADDPAVGEQLRSDLARIGIEATVVELSEANEMLVPANRTAIQAHIFAWGYNLTGTDLAQLLRGEGLNGEQPSFNFSLVGASAEQLADWGYTVTEVPSVDDMLAACDAEVGHLRARCWARLDQYVSEVLVPWVPLFTWESTWLVSDRVASFSLDQATPLIWIALDQVSLKLEAGE